MKKSTIVYVVVCTLVLMIMLPVGADPIQPFSEHQWSMAPGPAYATAPSPDTLHQAPLVRHHPLQASPTRDDVVISMIEQVDTTVYQQYLESLTADGPRPTESANCIAAAEFLYNEFEGFGLDVRYHHWTNSGYEADNVEATLYGADESSDDLYIICAHYDTTTSSPGADDDTSGTIAVVLAAMIMSQYQFNHTIKFVGFSGEEQGLLGSAVYAAEATSQGWDIIGVLNLDMVSYAITANDGNNLVIYEDTASEWLYTYASTINTEYADYIQLTLEHGGYHWGSDHNSFWDEGFTALDFFEHTKSPYYHTSQDTPEHVNISYAVKNIRLAIATLAELAGAGLISNPPARPQLSGPVIGSQDVSYTFSVVTTEPDGEDVYYLIDWGDGTNTGWFGPYSPGTEQTAQKSWGVEATFLVTAQAKDINEVMSEWSDPHSIIIIDDAAPATPSINGQKRGRIGINYTFTVSTIDVDGDQVYFMMDWGDGQVDDWVGPYDSGTAAELAHTWDEKGTYTVKVKAKDVYGIESAWGSMSVVMPLDSAFVVQGFLQRLFTLFPHAFPVLRLFLGS